jgi:hypothetical protein
MASAPTEFQVHRQLELGNFDGDRHQDFILGVTLCGGANCNPTQFHTLYGDGAGAFSAKSFSASGTVRNLAAFDVNHDGRSDLTISQLCDVLNCTASFGAMLGNANRTLDPSAGNECDWVR